MFSNITSDQSDSTQCPRCGVTLAARLLSCPSCGANQADSLDPFGWFPPTSSSAKARFPASPSSIEPLLAAPAAWNTQAGAEDDRFYAKYDPWEGPGRARRMPVWVTLVVALLVLAVAGYCVLRPGSKVNNVASKAVFGSVTAQQAGQAAAAPAPAPAPAPIPAPIPAPPPAAVAVPAPPAPVTRPAESLAAVPHGAISPAPEAKRDITGNQDLAHADVSKNLQIAHAMLQKDNLSAAESRVAAVLAAQPNNRDALSMREDLRARQQQRDAALDVARGCVYMGRWNCAWHNAGNALVVDSSSADAKRIVAQAMREAQLARAPPAAPGTESPHDLAPHH